MIRRRVAVALGTAIAIVGALAIGSAPASAQSGSFSNPQATPLTTDFDIATVDVTYTSTALTVTAHLQNFVGPDYDAEIYVLDGPVSTTTGKILHLGGSTPTGPDAPVTFSQVSSAGFGGLAPSTAATDVHITSNVSAQTVTFSIPSSHIFWKGSVYVVPEVTDGSTGDGSQAYVDSATGLGPVLGDPTPTVTSTTLTSPSQVYGSTPAAVSVTVSPANAGTVQISEGSVVVASGPVAANGSAIVILPASLGSGAHTLTARFAPTDAQNFAASTSVPFGLTVISVAKATKATVSLSKKSQVYKKKSAKITVSLSHKATGKITILDGKKKLKTLTLKKGKATYTFSKKLKKGTHKIKVVYTPTNKEAFKASTSKTVVFKVTK